jgi:hypothetical protein
MTNIPGGVDDDLNPVWNPWYIPGWTSQNEKNLAAPPPLPGATSAPGWLVRVNVVHNYVDGIGNPLGGYLTFEQSEDLLITDTTQTPTTYYTQPKRMVGDIPLASTLSWNEEGSGKIHLWYGVLTVILLATDNTGITILSASSDTSPPTTWNYHVREYWYRGWAYDIAVPSADASTTPDLYELIVPGTMKRNHDWNRGF